MVKIIPLSEIIERQYNKRMNLSGDMIVCPGCGGGIMAQALARACYRIGMSHDKLVIIYGIHCSGSQVRSFDCSTLGVVHGRAISYATGLKLARPELTVITVQGDGDAVGIGGNHFIHAARRNIDITTIVANNFVFGRTGGQHGPTTPEGAFATSAPYGTIDSPLDICKLAEAAGATFVARGITYHAIQLVDILEKAIRHHGYSAVEVLAQCPTSFGRRNPQMGRTAPEMLKWMRDNTIPVEKAKNIPVQELEGKTVTGIFVCIHAPEYSDKVQKMIEMEQK